MKKQKKNEKLKKRLTREILAIFRNSKQKKLNYKQVSAKLLITQPHEKMLVSSVLKQLAAEGRIKEIEKGKYTTLRKEKIRMEGTIEITRNGTGYLASDLFDKDIYIAPRNTGKAINKDTVLVEVDPNKRTPEGVVLKVVKRHRDTFVGLMEAGKKQMFVIPDDFKVNVDFYIPAEHVNGARDGDKVIVKVIDWPPQANNPFARVLSVLGPSGDHNVEMHAILHEYGLPAGFPGKVKQAAASINEGITAGEIAKRRDFRKVPTFTIDPLDAKDFDDALSVEFLDNGNFRIGVHIADVSHYVTPGSILDNEAKERSTSVYLVDRVVPMLPEIISNVICSLRPDEDKLTYSAVFDLDDRANIKKVWIGKTVIHSNRRFTYQEAQQILEGKAGDYKDELHILNKLAKILRAERFDHGSIDFGSSEVRFKLDENGIPIGIEKKVMQDANRLIEEFMLLANRKICESVGKVPKGQTPHPFIYRIHEYPDEQKLSMLAAFASKFGYMMKRVKGKAAASAINRLVHASEGQPEEDLIKRMAIKSMAKAVYSPDNIGHYGLAFDYYTHFTSPIRRYPDLVVHRLLDAYAKGQSPYSKNEIGKICDHASLNERRAVDAERASIKFKQVEYISDKIGQEFSGMISGLTNWGLYIEILDGLVEGMVTIQSLKDDTYYFDQKEFTVRGSMHGHEYNIGDKVYVKVLKTDLYRRQIDFEMVE